MPIETFEYRGAVITLDYDQDAPCPIEGAGSWAEGVGIVRNDRTAFECDPDEVLKAVHDYEYNCEMAELYGEPLPEKPNVYVFEYTAHELYGAPSFTVAVDRDAVADAMGLEVATDADCKKYGENVARVYAMWAEGAVYYVRVVLPDGEAESLGGVYFDSPYPDRDEVVGYVEGCLCTWDDPADDESEDDATGGAMISVKVSDAVKNLGGAGFSAGEVEVILGALGSGV